MEIGDYHLVVEYNMDKITEIALGIIKAIGMNLGEEILEWIKLIEDKIMEEDIEEIIGTVI